MPAPVHPSLRSSKTRPHYTRAIVQALALQRVVLDGALDGKPKPLELASLARVWCELEEAKRKLRMKPLPKAVDVSHLHRSKKKRDDSGIAPAGNV